MRGVSGTALVAVGVVAVVAAVGGLRLAARATTDERRPPDAAYVEIERVPSRAPAVAAGPDASRGTARSPCGRNEIGHRNADNPIAAPGRQHGSHGHEYVGNLSTDAFSSDASLASAGTTCTNGDTSAYFWPLLRIRSEHDPAGSGHRPGVTPERVLVEFRGNPSSRVVPMPRFLRLVTGDARAVTTPAAGASAPQWSCVGQTDRITPWYPLCPAGTGVVRIFDFPGCWDGRRIDSADHRQHAAFAAANGVCPQDYFPIPQLHLEVVYPVPPGHSYAIDSFPDQERSPLSDHGDFINVMTEPLMAKVVSCINSGRRC